MEIKKRGPGRPRQDHCKRGHALSGENVYIAPGGERQCRACQHDRHVAWRAANRERWNAIAGAASRRSKARQKIIAIDAD